MSISSSQFDSLFKPLPKEDLISRRLSNCVRNEDGTYSSDGDVNLSNLGLTKLPVKFKYVKDDFNCSDNQLTSLEGVPQKVGGDFYCSGNPVPCEKLMKTVKRSYLK